MKDEPTRSDVLRAIKPKGKNKPKWLPFDYAYNLTPKTAKELVQLLERAHEIQYPQCSRVMYQIRLTQITKKVTILA